MNHKHSYKLAYSSSCGNSVKAAFKCKCGDLKEKELSKKEKFALKRVDNQYGNIHKVFHDFLKKFANFGGVPTVFKSKGADLSDAVEVWAKKYPNDVRMVRCDDSFHSTSDLVLIEHKSKNYYMGTTAVYIPQCSGEDPIEFFLYPSHTNQLIKALQEIKRAANPIQKAQKKLDKARELILSKVRP